MSARAEADTFWREESLIRDLAGFVKRVSRVERPDIVWHQLKDFSAKLGLQYIFVVSTVRIGARFAPILLYSDSPRKIIQALDQDWPPARNPVLRHTKSVMKPFTMSEAERDATFIGFDWRKFAHPKARAGDALVVPIADGKLDGVAVLAGPDPDLGPLSRALIQVAAQFAFQRVSTISRSGKTAQRPENALNKRERDCLRLAAMGKKDAQIALALGISLRTVRFHFANAKAKLGASTRSEAIAMAASARA